MDLTGVNFENSVLTQEFNKSMSRLNVQGLMTLHQTDKSQDESSNHLSLPNIGNGDVQKPRTNFGVVSKHMESTDIDTSWNDEASIVNAQCKKFFVSTTEQVLP